MTTDAIDQATRLATDMAGPTVKMDKQDRICLESKEELEKRGLDAPDDCGWLALKGNSGNPSGRSLRSPTLPRGLTRTICPNC